MLILRLFVTIDASNDTFIVQEDEDVGTEDNGNESEFVIASPILFSYPDSKTFKVKLWFLDFISFIMSCLTINVFQLVNSNMKYRVKRFKNGSNVQVKNAFTRKKNSDVLSEKDGSDESDFLYPRLQLTRKIFSRVQLFFVILN